MLRRDFDDGSNTAEESGHRDGETASAVVSEFSSDQRANESTGTQQGGDGALSDGTETVGAIGLELTEATGEVIHSEETWIGY